MYIILKTVNNDTTYFSVLSYNGIFVENTISKAIIFPTVAGANNQKLALQALDSESTYTVKQIVLQDPS